jgi:uncharacterized Tic20 family protein
MLTQREKNTAFLTHLSAFASFIFPFGAILGPLIMWSVNKNRSEFVDENGVQAVNFNISYVLYVFVLGAIAFPFAFGSIFNRLRHIDDFDNIDLHLNFNWGFDNLFGILSVGSIIAIIVFIRFILTIVAAVKASRGETYKYPLTIKFIK